MEFDEYEYLEKMTEANDSATKAANNNNTTTNSSHVTSEVGNNNNNHNGNDRDSRRNSSYKRRSGDTSDVHDHRSKRTRAEDDEREKERGGGEKERDRSSRSVRGDHGLVVPPVAGAVDAIGQPSEYLLLKNMFDPTSESDPDFDLDIKEDVQEECSKFSAVKHIFVDKNSAGHVYLCFDSITAAMAAQRALHGRWFAGKMITATYMSAAAYQTKFPESR